ncbi:MAG TPA: ABC transporter permease [Devosia sp.]|nr:ABC transporter permease [Devosia sp.]
MGGKSFLSRMMQGQTLPVLIVIGFIIVFWYIAAVWLNAPWQLGVYERAENTDWTPTQFISDTLNQERPVLPSAHQVAGEIWKTTVQKKITSRRSLIYHAWITLSATLLGFVIGSVLGILLAIGIVHSRAMDKSTMPWIIASQTIPILAIAPMIIVVLNAIGISGVLPKALISTYLSFFPVAVGMVKGFRSPEQIQLDLMHTYAATKSQVFWKLRWFAALPYLFTSMKIAISISLVGAIVGELPTGAVAGLGARLLSGSYYGQTVQIWSALVMAAALAAALVTLVGVVERFVTRRMGARP